MSSRDALLVFIRAPEVGKVKTRLQPQMSPGDGLALYRAMVEDALDSAGDSPTMETVVFVHPPGHREEIREWLGEDVNIQGQEGENLGQRMTSAFVWAFEQDYDKVLLTGSDIPGLDSRMIVGAAADLSTSDVVLGPTEDGGYYLIGLKSPFPDLFSGMVWGTSTVLEETERRIEAAGKSLVLLEPLNDIDTYEDAESFWRSAKKQGANASRTHAVLQRLFGTEGM